MKALFVILCVAALAACGPSTEEVERIVDERLAEALTAVPMATPQPAATPQSAVDFNRLYRESRAAVFFIEIPDASGTGWLVEPGFIVTNQHVVAGYSTVRVRQALDPPFTARVVATDSLRDIALLRFNPETAPLNERARPFTLGDVNTNGIAQALMALGYSEGSVKEDGTVGGAAANVGVLSQLVNFGPQGQGLNLVMDTPSDPGDSGGPVLDVNGQVLGMVRAVRERTAGGQRVVGTFYAVHVDEIREALPTLKAGESR